MTHRCPAVIYDGTTLVCEMDASGAVTATNTFGANGLVSRRTGTTSVFYTFDPQGSVAQRLDASGNILSTDLYDAYGNRLAGNPGSDPHGYGGQWGYHTDVETGLILCTYRYYDPLNGHWLTRDPIGYEGGVNLYGYVKGNPVNRHDGFGLQSDSDCLQQANLCRSNASLELKNCLAGVAGGGIGADLLACVAGCAIVGVATGELALGPCALGCLITAGGYNVWNAFQARRCTNTFEGRIRECKDELRRCLDNACD